MRYHNLPTDMLRTFVTVADLKSFTRAGEAMGRSQPAVSLQIRRLEEILECQLIDTSGRQIVLTEQGDLLVRFARQLLMLNDEAVARIAGRPSIGRLRVGLPVDYAVAFFQTLLTNFVREHADVELSVHCDLSATLHEKLNAGEIDLAIAMYEGAPNAGVAFAWAERPIWASSSDGNPHEQSPIPLVTHHQGCEYRERMIHALDRIERPWRIAYASQGINSLQTAVLAGWGITALTRRTLLPGMRTLGEAEGLPPLPDVHVGLHYKHASLSTAGVLLASTIMQSLQDSGQADLIKVDRPFRAAR
ncbi:MAG: LysR substrate-binding domain-containing protein [Hyphomicrobiaceae bacterium]